MPNKPRRHKKDSGTSGRRTSRISPKANSVKDLLGRVSPVLSSIAEQSARQQNWRKWLAIHLPATLAGRITGIVERDAELVIFSVSASWGVRLRYALAELTPELQRAHPTIQKLTVRVLPTAPPPDPRS
jgi:hypothetical protein